MNKNLKLFPLILLALITTALHAQVTTRGTVIDANSRQPLAGVSVTEVGSSHSGTTNDDGAFIIPTEKAGATLRFTFVGYNSKDTTLAAGSTNAGTIELESTSTSLSEIMVTANNLAIDRKTPVAVSTVGTQFIQEKLGNQEFPEVLKTTPGIYVTRAGGGFGDATVRIRGFKGQNVAVMINGIPVNDMENGTVYWSNWSGLSDVTSSMQVQRGLGASKVAIPSVGGTINVTTRTTDVNKGGSIYYGIGNDGYQKLAFDVSTGLSEKGWAFSVLGSKTTGDGWADGLQFEGYNYFFNVSKKINEHHTLSLTGFGSPQWHGQRSNRQLITTFKVAPQGLKYNADWGYKDGQVVNVRDNFYHKPQFSLNHNWNIDETSFLTTALYASVGSGGGGNINGANVSDPAYRNGNLYNPYDLNAMMAKNQENADGSASIYRYASRNDHNWYGLLSTYKKKVSDFDLSGGLDLRYYKGKHFQEITDLLGADYFLNKADINHPNQIARVGDRMGYHDEGIVLWEGIFLQGEYSRGPLSAFVNLSGSNTSNKRNDYYKYLASDPLSSTDFYNFLGYNAKGGLNYNFATYHNVFVNIGHFSKAPAFDAVFPGNQSVPNEDAPNEKITSYELGYGFSSRQFNAKVNAYYTTWTDQTQNTFAEDQTTGETLFANLLGVDSRHMGVEMELVYKPVNQVTIRGMLSVGNWENTNDLDSVIIYDEQQKQIGKINKVFSKGKKIGDQAQTSGSLSVDYRIFNDLTVGATYVYQGRYYSSYFPSDMNRPGLTPWEIPNYSLVDLNASIRFKIGGVDGVLFANVNNLFDTEYLSDSNAIFSDDGVSDASNSLVFFGTGRTYSTGIKVNF